MLDGLFNSHGIVDHHIAHVFADSAEILADNRNILSNQFINQLGIEFGSHEGHAGHLQSNQTPNVVSGTIRVVVCVEEDRVIPAFESSALDALHQVWEKRVGNVRHEQTDHV